MERHASLKGVEIFEVGTWKGKVWSTAHLDEMVANFERLREYVKPFLKLGHDDKQVIEQENGQPALGWVERVYRKGDKLLADFSSVPKALVKLIRNGSYQRVSSEIWRNFEASQAAKELGDRAAGAAGTVLHAVSLLGAEMPQVTTLADLATVLEMSADALAEVADPAPGTETVELVRAAYAPGSLLGFSDAVSKALRRVYAGTPSEYRYFVRDLFPDAVVVECEDGELTRYPITRDAEGEVMLGDPEEVSLNYVPSAPRTDNIQNPPKGDDMTEAEIKAMIERHTASYREEIATLRGQVAEVAPTKDKLAAAEAEIVRLRTENDARRADEDRSRRELRRREADAFIAEFSTGTSLRVVPGARPFAVALIERLPDEPTLFSKDEVAERELFTDGSKTARPVSALDLFKAFVRALPELSKRYVETLSAASPEDDRNEPTSADEAIQKCAADAKLDLATPAGMSRAADLAARKYPHFLNSPVARQ